MTIIQPHICTTTQVQNGMVTSTNKTALQVGARVAINSAAGNPRRTHPEVASNAMVADRRKMLT
ncbi:hypothetical protein X976_3983 [Burkholderia pseudomallei MSHR7500]|nr:hypothetical protein X977_3947 [Burkholderia pseudomallei MSHR7504]KGS23554.1 hypothetical protein X962_5036 [Burkholderia pseudomallei MSHR7343]KGS40776.1 hypothetical protein X945_4273 [Burkholderia pseudomallei ABCPW 107]KGS61700.1 hypothetical protein X990_5112 [Burkholderia pseudomallei MSHR4868]KGS78048.1 hypothetical protein X942_4492 [Burkholderia pseudomallei MSHR5596]KGS87111.1 hypothetical protein X976_3983 [Burkholderia pseudomallei MSHR7500]KGW18628.1 hypothetical protein X980